MHSFRKPTYLFVLPWPLSSIGGVTQVVMNLYRECERSGMFEPLIMILDFERSKPAFEVVDGFRCVRLCLAAPASAGVTVRGMLAFARRAPFALWRLKKLLSSARVKVVNAHYPTLSAVNFLLLRRLGLLRDIKLVLSFHGTDIRSAQKRDGVEKRLWRWMMRNSDRFVTCSDALRADLAFFGSGLSSKVMTVRNAVDVARVKELVASIAPPAGCARRRYILNIGTFERQKGHEVLLEAFGNLADDYPGVDLVILGRDGPMRPDIERMISELRLERRVRRMVDIGYAETLRELSAATLFVLPSRAEGLPLVVLEAGALGVPVVASRVGGIPEVIDRDDLGVLVPPGDATALEVALRNLIDDDALRAKLGVRLHEHVTARFSWQRAWGEYMAAID